MNSMQLAPISPIGYNSLAGPNRFDRSNNSNKPGWGVTLKSRNSSQSVSAKGVHIQYVQPTTRELQPLIKTSNRVPGGRSGSVSVTNQYQPQMAESTKFRRRTPVRMNKVNQERLMPIAERSHIKPQIVYQYSPQSTMEEIQPRSNSVMNTANVSLVTSPKASAKQSARSSASFTSSRKVPRNDVDRHLDFIYTQDIEQADIKIEEQSAIHKKSPIKGHKLPKLIEDLKEQEISEESDGSQELKRSPRVSSTDLSAIVQNNQSQPDNSSVQLRFPELLENMKV